MNGEHQSWESVLDLIESHPTGDEVAWAHLRSCGLCSQLARDALVVLGTLEFERTPGYTESVLARAWKILQGDLVQADRSRVGRALDGGRAIVREIWATLASDSLTPSHAVRGATAATPRALVFDADAFKVSISLSEVTRDHTVDLQGWIIPVHGSTLPSGGQVRLASGSDDLEAPVDENGRFRYQGVSVGVLDLGIEIGDAIIHVGPFSVAGDVRT